MPATEQTWRDTKKLHVIFGLTSLGMLVATIFMLALDNVREWKVYQRKFRDIETWVGESRISEEQTTQFAQREAKLQSELETIQNAKPNVDAVNQFISAAETKAVENKYNVEALKKARDEAAQDSTDGKRRRERLISAMDTTLKRAKFIEDNAQRDLKFKRADLDVVNSEYSIGVDEGKSPRELSAIQERIDSVRRAVQELTLIAEGAKTHRLQLQNALAATTADEAAAKKALADHEGDVKRLETALAERAPNTGKTILEMPIIDAFGRPLKVEQIWLPQLTQNNNFRDVARFDRCTTCHQGIDKTAPGSAVAPGYEQEHQVSLSMATPTEADVNLAVAFGIRLAAQPQPPTVNAVSLHGVAAQKGFESGDVIKSIEGSAVTDHDKAVAALLDPKLAGKTVKVAIERKVNGENATLEVSLPLPEQYTTVVKQSEVTDLLMLLYGLRLAKEGIVNASDIAIEAIWPRTAAALAEAMTGDVIESINDVRMSTMSRAETYLLKSVDWGKPLALTVRRGAPQPFSSHPRLDLFVGSLSPHKLGDFGCTICHEGQGSATQFKWASHTPNSAREAAEWKTEHGWFNNHHWIFPMLPERFLESNCLKCHHDVAELMPSEKFPEPPAAKLVAGWDTIKDYGCFGCHEINGYDGPSKRRGPDLRAEPNYASLAEQVLTDAKLTASQRKLAEEVASHPDRLQPRKRLAEQLLAVSSTLSPVTKKMAEMLGADDETPGRLRRVGPSLRHLASKVDAAFVYDWVSDPTNFRPTTKMPKFFGLHDHLYDLERDAHGDPVLDEHGHAKKKSTPDGLGKAQRLEPVEIRAISEYLLSASQKFDYIAPATGAEAPSVERGKAAFETRGCLACHKHPDFPLAKNTQGPNLERLGGKLKGEQGTKWLYSWLRQPTHYHARTSMPNVFLEPIKLADGKTVDPAADIVAYLLSSKDWQPKPTPDLNSDALDELVQMFLKGAFTSTESQAFAKTGIPADRGANIKGDEALLVAGRGELTKQKLIYAGKKTVARLGCAGCHDIPGLEDSKPIGTGLADWGRKEPSKLAFEQIIPYLHNEHAAHGGGGHGHDFDTKHMDDDESFFIDALTSHQREGFLWQKLREPRSYDFAKTENKDYLDRLRMPKFNLTDEQREAIMTFVLGLVAEPPAAKYVYKGTPRSQAISRGREVLEKFNCVGCHTVEMESWDFDYDPHNLQSPPPLDPTKDYAFVQPHFTPQELAASKKVDRRGLGHARVFGMPNPEVQEDPDTGKPLWFFAPWKPVALNGNVWAVGGQEVPMFENMITAKHAPYGGDLARLLHPIALANEKKANPNAKASDAWGWVPPPLQGEGQKVRPEWLYEFLLEPYPIRPAVILRMPKFNLSANESAALVDFFAAKDNAQYPYEFDGRTWSEHVMSESEREPFTQRLDGALKIVTDNNYCVKCHLVGDYTPKGSSAALAPQLDRVSSRLRPDFLQKWLAKPQSQLPYTGMPVNFPADKPADQKLLAGSAEQQLQAVVDLLLNWGQLMKAQPSNSIKPRVKEAPPMPAAAAGGGE